MKSGILDRVRWGNRMVLWTMDHGLGLGNHLYLWLHAHIEQSQGRDYRVLATEAQRQWLERFPSLEGLSVEPGAVQLKDKREWDVTPRLYQRFGTDYTRDQLHAFIRAHLTPHLPDQLEELLVINVRRGDYYTAYREKYGMNLAGYLDKALTVIDGAAERLPVLFVSDDPAWCQENLGDRFGAVTYAAHDPWENFVAVTTASHLVGTNSTFSYWSGYIGDVIGAGGARRVVMPWFHARTVDGGAAFQLDPEWTIIKDPAGGWAEPPKESKSGSSS